MSTTLEWADIAASVTCRLCEYDGNARAEAIIHRPGEPDLTCVRCPSCGSVDIQGDLSPHYADGNSAVDDYVENGISIEAVAEVIATAGSPATTSLLDVGCNYGFGVDLGQRLFGWHSRGIEPTAAGLRGREELGVPIEHAPLTSTTDVGERFDLVIASEVLEHVPDPMDFLAGIGNHLSKTGVVLFTTPSAEALDRTHDDRDVLQALSPGLHEFLPSVAGLELLLHRAGFLSVTVQPRGDNIRALASLRVQRLDLETPGLPQPDLEPYYRNRSADAPAGSALSVGMAGRLLRTLVNRGAYEEAARERERVFSLFTLRHGLDATDPVAAIEQVTRSGFAPWGLIPVAYSCGILALHHDHDPAKAVAYFTLTEELARVRATSVGVLDGDAANLVVHARRARATTLAGLGDDAVLDVLPTLDIESRVRTFTAAVVGGHLDLARRLRQLAADSAPRLVAEPSTIVAGLDGLLGLAMLDLQTGEPRDAVAWLDLARQRLESRAPETISDDHAAAFAADLDAQLRVAQDHAATLGTSEDAQEGELMPSVPGTISVVLPVYNGEAHVREAVQSIVNQTVSPDELVVIDDGSVDSSLSIIQSMDIPFPVRIHRQKNSGQSAARNAGGRHASGEFLAFIDQDDRWLSDHLEKLHAAISDDPAVGWVFTDFDQVDAEGNTITTHFIAETGVQHPKRSLSAVMSADLMALPSASMVRRSAMFEVGGFDPSLIGYEDDDLFLRLYRAGWRHTFLPSSTVRYRMHPLGASASPAFLQSRLRFMRKLLTTIPDDHRMNHLFSQDVVVPRFLHATLADYASALAAKDYDLAGIVAVALREISSMQGVSTLRRRIQLAALDHPRRMRAVLLALERLPRRLRPRVPAALFFGSRSVVRAARFHPTLPPAA